ARMREMPSLRVIGGRGVLEGQAACSSREHIEATFDVVKHQPWRLRAFTNRFTLFTGIGFA
ncbi:MAG: hypothetical protein EBS87_12075, partial [Sphingomonadaceae bacterium]|nr:hypothetical protein [Sphingomonadaceae bacterium]